MATEHDASDSRYCKLHRDDDDLKALDYANVTPM